MQVAAKSTRHLLPSFGKVINALMRQAALPVPSFEVSNAPKNVPILIILFMGFPAGIK
jgi:hypothetical protein